MKFIIPLASDIQVLCFTVTEKKQTNSKMAILKVKLQWNPALRTFGYCGQFRLSRRGKARRFYLKLPRLIWTLWRVPLVSVITGFHCTKILIACRLGLQIIPPPPPPEDHFTFGSRIHHIFGSCRSHLCQQVVYVI